jgi:hypothetical protein
MYFFILCVFSTSLAVPYQLWENEGSNDRLTNSMFDSQKLDENRADAFKDDAMNDGAINSDDLMDDDLLMWPWPRPQSEFRNDCAVVVSLWKAMGKRTIQQPGFILRNGCCMGAPFFYFNDIPGVTCNQGKVTDMYA